MFKLATMALAAASITHPDDSNLVCQGRNKNKFFSYHTAKFSHKMIDTIPIDIDVVINDDEIKIAHLVEHALDDDIISKNLFEYRIISALEKMDNKEILLPMVKRLGLHIFVTDDKSRKGLILSKNEVLKSDLTKVLHTKLTEIFHDNNFDCMRDGVTI